MQGFEVTITSRKLVLFTILSSVFVKSFSLVEISSEKANSGQPHIIAIIADDLGWNDVSFHGSDQIPTPNIDALASNGVILNRYYTQPTCTPSRTAYLTGRYPLRNGMQGYPLKAGERWGIPLETTLLPEHLRNLGYTTRLVGKWHVGYYTIDHTPTHRGFDSFLGYYSGYVKYFDYTMMQDNFTGYDLHRDTMNSSKVELNGEYFTDVVTQEVEKIIANHNVSKPLYLQVAHLAPHAGEDDELLEVWNLTEVNELFGYIKDTDRRKYAGMVARLDHSVGQIVRALKEAEMLENSIIIFTSDNGAQTQGLHANSGSNYPLRGLKFTMYDGGVRGAACIYSPLLNRTSRVSNELMHISDWMPTLYSAAGGNLDDLGEIDGVNQWPSLKDGEDSPRESVLLNLNEFLEIAGAVHGKYKLLQGYQREYTDFYGDSGVGNDYPRYNATAVVTSNVGQAIAEISNSPATVEQIIRLRGETQISCAPFDEYVNCTDKCLFDLSQDPCETVDISAQYPEDSPCRIDHRRLVWTTQSQHKGLRKVSARIRQRENEVEVNCSPWLSCYTPEWKEFFYKPAIFYGLSTVEFIENYIASYWPVLIPQSSSQFDPAGSPDNFNGVWQPWVKLTSNSRQFDLLSETRIPGAHPEKNPEVEGTFGLTDARTADV